MLELKLEFLINPYKFLIKLNWNFLEILQPFTEAVTRSVPYKKLFLKI